MNGLPLRVVIKTRKNGETAYLNGTLIQIDIKERAGMVIEDTGGINDYCIDDLVVDQVCRDRLIKKCNPPDLFPELRKQFAEVRNKNKLGLRAVGKMTGIAFSTLCRFELGEGNPTEATIDAIEEWLAKN